MANTFTLEINEARTPAEWRTTLIVLLPAQDSGDAQLLKLFKDRLVKKNMYVFKRPRIPRRGARVLENFDRFIAVFAAGDPINADTYIDGWEYCSDLQLEAHLDTVYSPMQVDDRSPTPFNVGTPPSSGRGSPIKIDTPPISPSEQSPLQSPIPSPPTSPIRLPPVLNRVIAPLPRRVGRYRTIRKRPVEAVTVNGKERDHLTAKKPRHA